MTTKTTTKTKITMTTRLTALLLITAFAFNSCKKDLQDLLQNDLMFNMDANAFLQNQVQLHVVNAVGTNGTAPNAKISIKGKDAQLVYDINGGKDVVVAKQFANLAVSPGKPLSPAAPAVFTVQATAPGFLPYEQVIEVSNLDSFLNYTFEMVEINNPPAGVIAEKANLDFSAGKSFAIGTAKSNQFSGSLQINANTVMRDPEGNVVSGVNQVDWKQFDTKNEVVLSNIPHLINNFSTDVYVDKVKTDFPFLPMGYAQLNISKGNTQVKQFDQAVQLEFSLPNGTIDRTYDAALEAGDGVGVYHRNELTNGWDLIAEPTLVANAGKLKVAVPVFETGDFAIASRRTRPSKPSNPGNGGGGGGATICSSTLGLKFTRANNINTLHYIEVVNGSGTVLASASDVQVFHNGTYNFTAKLPSNTNVTVKVYEYEKASYKGNVLVTSAQFSSCSKTTSSRLTIDIPTMNTVARFELDTYCADSKLFYYHDGRIQYKVKGASDATYKDMGLAKKSGRNSTEIIRNSGAVPVQTASYSFLETDRLVSGVTYTFRTEISGRHKTTKKTVKQVFTRDRLYNLNNGEFSPYTGTSPAQYTFQKFNRGYWIAPTNACAIFGY